MEKGRTDTYKFAGAKVKETFNGNDPVVVISQFPARSDNADFGISF
jgi:hypothetical protein